MAYPTLSLHSDSKRIVRDGRDEQLAVGGQTYVRSFYVGDKFDFEIRHLLTIAQLGTLQAFYEANPSDAFDFFWPGDGTTYTGMRFGRGGLAVKWVSPFHCEVSVRIVSS